MRLLRCALATFVLLVSATPILAQAGLRLIKSTEPIAFDGRLDEPVWKSAPSISAFYQREPLAGEVATENTEVRIVYHKQALYVGILCFDRHPELIVAKEMKRDGDVDEDDHVAIVLDTYSDRRNAFYIAVNPNGVLNDALVVDEGKGFNEDWNGIWDAKARVTEQGWQAEIMIPFDALRFKSVDQQLWGLNVARLIRRKNEEVLWRAYARNAGLMRISEAGALEGVPRVRAAHRFELWPYTTGAWIAAPQSPGAERLANDLSAKFGFNAKIKITENLTGDVTVNTDFAQTEVDKAVVNLTRFPVQLPEKREFFLENAGFFGFASPDQTSVFFSRRIGLSANGEPLPIDFGGRVTGKIGRWDVGVLNVESRASGETPAMNSTVLRAKLGVLQKSYVGAILTNAHSAQDGNRNQAYGVDSQLSFSNVFGQNVSFTASLAGTSTAGARRDRHAAYAGVLYPNDQLEAFFNYSFIDRGFNPELGFLKRSGFDRFSAKWRFQPRPPAPFDKWIRKIDVKPLEINVYRSLPGRELESLSQEFRPIGADFQSGDSFEFNVIRHFDRLDEPFDVLDDVIIAPGRYWWTSYELQLDTAEKRRWQLSAACSWGEYYSGRMKELSLDGNISLTQRLKVSAEYATNRADVGGSGFTTHEIAARVLYAFTNRANVQVFTQWNNESHHADVYVRLQISPKVGSDIYGVFNQLLDTRKGRRANIGRAARVKAVYPLYF